MKTIKIKINLPAWVRVVLLLLGSLCVILAYLSRGGVLSDYSQLRHPFVIYFGLAFLVLGFYSQKEGFGGKRDSGHDEAPGFHIGRHKGGSGADDDFSGGE